MLSASIVVVIDDCYCWTGCCGATDEFFAAISDNFAVMDRAAGLYIVGTK